MSERAARRRAHGSRKAQPLAAIHSPLARCLCAPQEEVVQYSEPHSQTGGLVRFSPCGRLLAGATNYRLIVRDVDTLQIVQLYSCMDAIEDLEWSCDSEYVLCSFRKRGAAQVWSMSDKEWHCKIDEGPVGLAHARFSPDGRHVLAVADFRLRITIWSLCDRSVYYIRFPKHADKVGVRPYHPLAATLASMHAPPQRVCWLDRGRPWERRGHAHSSHHARVPRVCHACAAPMRIRLRLHRRSTLARTAL